MLGVSVVLLAGSMCLSTARRAVASPPAGYSLSWSDEFNQAVNSQPSSANWNFDLGIGPNNDGWGNWEQESYVNDVTHCHVISDSNATDGKALQIEATNDGNWATYGFHSARLDSIGHQEPEYGYIEIRAKNPYSQGIWPAFWMLGNNYATAGWPECGEMDIMEIFGQNDGTNMGSFHMGTESARIDWTADYTLSGGAQFSQAYHTFGLLWTSSAVTEYVDGVQYQTHPSSSPGWVFNHPFYFILNLAVGGIPPGDVVKGTTVFPQYLDVDYVRVYEPGSGGGTISNGVYTLTPGCATGSRLDDANTGTTNGNKVEIYTSNGSQAENWSLANTTGSTYNMAVNVGPYCLDAGAAKVGTATEIWGCDGAATQGWTATSVSGGYKFTGSTGLCLDVSGAGTANGTTVDSYTCNGTSAQTWALTAN